MRTEQLNILVYSAAGGNVGDDAIFLAVRDRLGRLFPTARITLACPDPSAVARHGVADVVPTFGQLDGFFIGRSWLKAAVAELRQTYRAFQRADLVILGGGGLLNDQFGSQWLSQWAVAPVVAKALRKPAIILGVGAGPLVSSHARAIVRNAVRCAVHVTVRDDYSAMALEHAGVPRDLVHVTADPVYGLQQPTDVAAVGENCGWVAIIPRFDGPDGKGGVCHYLQLVDQFQHSGLQCKLLCMSDYDAEVLRAAMNLSDGLVIGVSDPKSMLSAVRSAGVVVSTRMHGCLLSAIAGVPVVPIATYDPKLQSIATQLEVPFASSDVTGNLPVGEIVHYALHSLEDQTIRTRLHARVLTMRERADQEDPRLLQIVRGLRLKD